MGNFTNYYDYALKQDEVQPELKPRVLIIVGSFSCGKSSLVNSLMSMTMSFDQTYLPTAGLSFKNSNQPTNILVLNDDEDKVQLERKEMKGWFFKKRSSYQITDDEDKVQLERKEMIGWSWWSQKTLSPKQQEENSEVKEWFQEISLSPEQQEKYATCFIQKGFDNLNAISHMTEGDLKLMKEKLNLSSGNYRKICVAVDALKQRSKFLNTYSNLKKRSSYQITDDEDKVQLERKEMKGWFWQFRKILSPKQQEENSEVKEWFQEISLSPEQQEKYATCFIQKGFDNLNVISHMTEGDLKLMKKKLNLSSGNYRKICVAVDALKQRSKSSSSNKQPWHIDPSVKNLGTWIKVDFNENVPSPPCPSNLD